MICCAFAFASICSAFAFHSAKDVLAFESSAFGVVALCGLGLLGAVRSNSATPPVFAFGGTGVIGGGVLCATAPALTALRR